MPLYRLKSKFIIFEMQWLISSLEHKEGKYIWFSITVGFHFWQQSRNFQLSKSEPILLLFQEYHLNVLFNA